MTVVLGQRIFLNVRRVYDIVIALCFIITIYSIYRTWSPAPNNKSGYPLLRQEGLSQNDALGRPDLAKYIHLDLKGAPPKADPFYESFFEFLEKVQMGVKGVVMEYEDTLPLEGNLINVTHRAGYTKSDIKLITESAKKHQLEIIPLIQTFGHFEWLLKLNEFQSYREDENLPNVISPCINATYALLEDLLRQTLDMHPNSKIIHIGCDEVILTNSRAECSTKPMSTYERYINHIQRVALIVRQIRPDIRILIWDDILRNEESINNQASLAPLKGLVETVSWHYLSKFDEQYKSSSAWKIYPKFFPHMWGASAFKGGLYRFSMMTNTTHHVLNNLQWLHFMQSSTFPKESFSAFILTGWSRFDHFMPLCDLFPTAIPSLLYSLHALNTNQPLPNNEVRNCAQLLKSIGKSSDLCNSLPGRSLWSSIWSLSHVLAKTQTRLKLLHTVAPEYNRKHSFVRRHELHIFLGGLEILRKELAATKQVVYHSLAELYHEDVINEWFGLYVMPTENQINTTIAEFSPSLQKITWPRRPFL